MDTLAHGLWGGAAFGQKRESPWGWAFLLGMCPDLFSFGPYFLTRLPDLWLRLRSHQWGPPDPHLIPTYVYHSYNVTHSLVMWVLIFIIVAKFKGRIFWPLAAWALHILCDIPLHSTRFFPTPYLWPLPTPFYNGAPWASKTFMIANYSCLAAVYVVLFIRSKIKQSPSE